MNQILTWFCLVPIAVSLMGFGVAAIYDRATKYRQYKHD